MLIYFIVRFLSALLSLLPRSWLLNLGKGGGVLLYHLHREFRKKTLTNLSIAFGNTYPQQELKRIAVDSFQNLAISALEFISLKGTKHLQRIAYEGSSEAEALLEKKKGVVFLSAHQANWEIPFLAATARFPGIGIGRPIKNKRLYRWVLSIREMHKGRIVMPKNALKEGFKALMGGQFVGIVGDQAYPPSSYSYPFFGTRAWTSTSPALLAYRTNSPLVVASTRREGKGFVINLSSAIYPDLTKPLKEEIPRLMDLAMHELEKSIEKTPGEWLWQHDKWKQQRVDYVKRSFRYAFILVILPPEIEPYLPLIPLLRKIYPTAFLSFLLPAGKRLPCPEATCHYYRSEEDLFLWDYRYQMVLDFYDRKKVRRHYLKLGAFQALNLDKMKKISQATDIKEVILKSLCKPYAARSLLH